MDEAMSEQTAANSIDVLLPLACSLISLVYWGLYLVEVTQNLEA